MPRPKLTFVLNSKAGEWEAIEPVLDLADANPFGGFSWLTDDRQSTPEKSPYERRALQGCLERRQCDVLLHRDDGPEVALRLTLAPPGINIQLSVEAASLTDDWHHFVAYAERWVGQIPRVTSGRIFDADADVARLYREMGLARPPACFSTALRWRHYLGAEFYRLFLSPDDLLAAPARHIETLNDGLVAMTCYAQPFAWNGEEARDRLARLTDYLNEKDTFMSESR